MVVYITRNAGLLVKFEGWEEVVEVVKIGLSIASVLLLRYSPHASRTYDESLDSLPRWVLLLPPFLLSLVFNRVVMIVEICRQFSWYLEPLVLIPQWLVMWRRKSYPFWVLAFAILAGLEGVASNMDLWLMGPAAMKQDSYRFVAAAVQLGVLCCGLLLLAFQRLTAGPGTLNESAEKPTFDEVWEAQKFTFQQENSQAGTGSRLV